MRAAARPRQFVRRDCDDRVFDFLRVDFSVFDVAEEFIGVNDFVAEVFERLFGDRISIISDRYAGL